MLVPACIGSSCVHGAGEVRKYNFIAVNLPSKKVTQSKAILYLPLVHSDTNTMKRISKLAAQGVSSAQVSTAMYLEAHSPAHPANYPPIPDDFLLPSRAQLTAILDAVCGQYKAACSQYPMLRYNHP
jgi:hypothetical protein